MYLLDSARNLSPLHTRHIQRQDQLFREITQKIPALLDYFGKSRKRRCLSNSKPVKMKFKLSKIKKDLTLEEKLRLGYRLEVEGFRLAVQRGATLEFFQQAYDPSAQTYASRIQLSEDFIATHSP